MTWAVGRRQAGPSPLWLANGVSPAPPTSAGCSGPPMGCPPSSGETPRRERLVPLRRRVECRGCRMPRRRCGLGVPLCPRPGVTYTSPVRPGTQRPEARRFPGPDHDLGRAHSQYGDALRRAQPRSLQNVRSGFAQRAGDVIPPGLATASISRMAVSPYAPSCALSCCSCHSGHPARRSRLPEPPSGTGSRRRRAESPVGMG